MNDKTLYLMASRPPPPPKFDPPREIEKVETDVMYLMEHKVEASLDGLTLVRSLVREAYEAGRRNPL